MKGGKTAGTPWRGGGSDRYERLFMGLLAFHRPKKWICIEKSNEPRLGLDYT